MVTKDFIVNKVEPRALSCVKIMSLNASLHNYRFWGREKKSLKCKFTKLHVFGALRISKKKFECKLGELKMFRGKKKSPKKSLNVSL
jgi:hypothetical protein